MISIAMCTYNGSQYIKEQLESIMQQTKQPDEIIICDDCSQDNTVQMAQHVLAAWPGKYKIIENAMNLGFRKNFQKAISLCQGDLIFLSDQDDVWNHNKIKLMCEQFTENDTILVFHDAELVDIALQPLKSSFWQSIGFAPEEFISGNYKRLLKDNVVQGSACCFRKALIKQAMPFPREAVHDEWLALAALGNGNIVPLLTSLTKYRQGHNTLGGMPMPTQKKAHKWLGNIKEAVKLHYIELVRRQSIFNIVAEKFGESGKFDFRKSDIFFQQRVACLQKHSVAIFYVWLKNFRLYAHTGYMMKEFIKDFLAVIFL